MQNSWREADAAGLAARYAEEGIGRDVADCIYVTRLLGRDKRLVLPGGGNSSVKMRVRDGAGAERDVLCIKASGTDMAAVAPDDLPALDLDQLRRLRNLGYLAEEEMRGAQRPFLLDGGAGDPSAETLLHAFLPHKYIAHCHANAILSVTNQRTAERSRKRSFPGRPRWCLTPCPVLSLRSVPRGYLRRRPIASGWCCYIMALSALARMPAALTTIWWR